MGVGCLVAISVGVSKQLLTGSQTGQFKPELTGSIVARLAIALSHSRSTW